MCKEDDNKAIVGRWFKDFWSTPSDLTVVDELAAPDVLLQYSPDTPRRGRDAVRAFRTSLRDAFPEERCSGSARLKFCPRTGSCCQCRKHQFPRERITPPPRSPVCFPS